MNGLSGVGNNARAYFEMNVRKMGPGYAATISGLSNSIRTAQVASPVADTRVHYGHVIDAYA